MDVWIIDLEYPGFEHAFRGVLDAQEIDRADRFHFALHRRRFITGHAAARYILASYLGNSPSDIQFDLNPYGKPALRNPSAPKFSLSHSHEKALLAVADDEEIGVDIEWCRELRHGDLARRFFSAVECATLDGLAAERKFSGFFSCWTRKEAYVKAKGLGLSIPLNSFSVEASPDKAAALLESSYAPDDLERFQMWDVTVAEGYTAALAYSGSETSPPRRCSWRGPG